MIWWLLFEKMPFLFWIQVVVISLQLYKAKAKSLKLNISGSTKFFTHCCYFLRWAYYLGPKLKSQNLQQDSLGCVFPNIVAIRYENEIFFRPDYFDYQIKICKFLPNFLKFGNWARCFDKFFFKFYLIAFFWKVRI